MTSIYISVIDYGIGIPKDEQKNIFTAFYRANSTKRIPGTGLGLSITKKYIESLKGEILVDSRVNEGTTFTIKFPFENKFSLDIVEKIYN